VSETSATDPQPATRARKTIRVLLALSLGSVGALVVLEIGLRFLPVNEVSGLSVVDAENPIQRLEPNKSFIRSRGPRLSLATSVSTNNVGFRNDADYELDSSNPLLALVGDSYIVAATVPYEETLAARLASDVEGHGRVYSFGIRGAALPQYLVWADYARESFQPDAFVFVIIANDFGGSLSRAPGYHYFRLEPDGGVELVRVDSRPSGARELLKTSTLASYLVMNCGIVRWGLFRRGGPPPSDVPPMRRFVANIAAQVPDARMKDYRRAFEAFLDRLPAATGVESDRILFAMDGYRPHMYDPADLEFAETSAWAELRAMVVELSTKRGIDVIDLHPAFAEHYARTGERMETKEDNHWSGVGHGVARDQVARSSVFTTVFGD
jgi:hypothetical protein